MTGHDRGSTGRNLVESLAAPGALTSIDGGPGPLSAELAGEAGDRMQLTLIDGGPGPLSAELAGEVGDRMQLTLIDGGPGPLSAAGAGLCE